MRRPRLTIPFAIAIALAGAAPVAAQDAPPAAPAEPVDGLRLTELTLTRAIEGGQATDPATTFARGAGPVQVLIRIENTTGAETEIRVSFERADRELVATTETTGAGVSLGIPAERRYRTQARTGTGAAGRFRVVVRTSAGNVLGSAEYEVTGG